MLFRTLIDCNVNRLERPEEAIIDASKALEFNPYSTKAIVAKGEALYKMGLFENALVQFHRGWRFRADPAIKIGMVRCTDEILNTIGDTNKEYDVAIVEKVIKKMDEPKLEKKPEPRKTITKRKEKMKPKDKLDNGKLSLGKICKDEQFLQNFIDFQLSQPMKSQYTVSGTSTKRLVSHDVLASHVTIFLLWSGLIIANLKY